MKVKNTISKIYWDGAISITKEYNFWNKLLRWIKGKSNFDTRVYLPKKKYSNAEQSKLHGLLLLNECTNEDNTVIVNTVRPNTFKTSILEVENSKYYVSAESESIYIYLAFQQV